MSSESSKVLTRISTGAAISFAGSGIGKLASFGATVVITNLLGAASYGSFQLGLSVMTLFLYVFTSGVNDAVIRGMGVAQEPAEQFQTYMSGLIISGPIIFAISAGLYIFSDAIATNVFGSVGPGVYIKYLSIGLPFATFSRISLAATRGWNRSIPTNLIRKVSFPLVQLSLVYVAIIIGGGDTGVAVAVLLSYVFVGVFSGYSVRRTYILIKSEASNTVYLPDRDKIIDTWKIALPLLVSSGAWILMNRADTLLLGYYLNEDMVGYYSAAFALATLFQVINQSVGTLFLNNVSELYGNGQMNQIREIYLHTTNWIVTGSVPLAILLIGGGPGMLLLFGPGFDKASLSLTILSLGILFQLFVGLNGDTIKAFNHTKWYTVVQLSTVLLNLVLNIILIPVFGIVGAAIATSLAYTFSNGAHCLYLWKKYRIKPISWNQLFLFVITCLAFIPILRVTEHNSIIISIVASVVGLLVFLLFSVKLGNVSFDRIYQMMS